MLFFAFADGEVVNWQWLYGIVRAVHVGQVFQDGLIDGAAYRKLEGRVEAQRKVRKILVGEGFDDDGRDGGQAGFAVVPVPQAPACPRDTETGADVLTQSGQYHVCQVA